MKQIATFVAVILIAVSAVSASERRLAPLPSAVHAETESATQGLLFHPLPPCRAYDALFQGGFVFDMIIRGFCGVPVTADAVSFTVAAVQPAASGNILFWASGPRPVASTMNYSPLAVTSSGGVMLLCDLDGPTECMSDFLGQSTHTINRMVLDVTGYYAAPD